MTSRSLGKGERARGQQEEIVGHAKTAEVFGLRRPAVNDLDGTRNMMLAKFIKNVHMVGVKEVTSDDIAFA